MTMCGVYACLGNPAATNETFSGLKQLQYRGYDSWGVAYSSDSKLDVYKSLETIDSFEDFPLSNNSQLAIGHTRWASHGEVSLNNCHPLLASHQQFCLVHNGIVENCDELSSHTVGNDTALILQLLEEQLGQDPHYQAEQLQQALCVVFKRLKGRNTVLLLDHRHQQIVAIKYGSPLILAQQQQRLVLCSDSYALDGSYQRFASLADHSLLCLNNDGYHYQNLLQGKQQLQWQQCNHNNKTIDPAPYKHFMLQEIMQQWHSVKTALPSASVLQQFSDLLLPGRRIFYSGAGGALFVAEALAAHGRAHRHLDARAVAAYDFDDQLHLMRSNDILVAVSQSGETADLLMLVQQAKQRGLLVVSLINASPSSLQELSDVHIPSRCGREICVLSTKSATAQLLGGISLHLATRHSIDQLARQSDQLSNCLAQYLESNIREQISQLATALYGQSLFVLGKGSSYYSAKITALNIKEASYTHAEAFTMGELKHGVLALITKGTPVIIFATDKHYPAAIAAAHEVKARGAFVIGVGDKAADIFDCMLILPHQNNLFAQVLEIIPGQLLAYQLATLQGINPDKPRNLAKSVTVV